jgi:hypothetical protein
MAQDVLLESLGGTPEWECWLRRPSNAVSAKCHDGGVIGVFRTREQADAEKGAHAPWSKPGGWECWLRRHSTVARVGAYDGGVIGVFRREEDARLENRQEADARRATRGTWKKVRL